MKILAIDCCLKLTGVALMIDGEVFHVQKDLERKQSQELPLMTERLLREHNLAWKDLDYIALTNGPGYFTGIRVGAAYATGLAYACGVKIIPVSTLELLAQSYGKQGKILTLIYSGHGYVYGVCKGYLEPGEYSHDEIRSWLANNPDAVIISDDPTKTLECIQVKPDLTSLCELAGENLDRAINPMNLQILYYKAPQGVNNYPERNE